MSVGCCSFVPDDLDPGNGDVFDYGATLGSGELTNTYLLALAAHHGAAFATFDRRMTARAVNAQWAKIFLIP